MHLFYAPQLAQGIHVLSPEESKHCIKVLRMRIGDKIELTDGLGCRYQAELANEDHKACELKILKKEIHKKDNAFSLHIAFCPVKQNDRNEWFLEKATELGVDSISLIFSERSERQKINMERYQRIMTEAMKQCLSDHLPLLNEAQSFKDFLDSNYKKQIYIAHCEDAEKKPLNTVFQNAKDEIIIMIGPEGDFSSKEIQLARKLNVPELSLGEQRLRTETAALSIAMAALLSKS